jgi:peptidoglycan/xylan/chitin deacetylase (PgdA/CDA1 family)
MQDDSTGRLVVSLDFELHWGVRDFCRVDQYQQNLLGVRQAVPRMLELFRRHEIHATWATVGFLFARNREELLASLPDRRPAYARPELDPYRALGDELGRDEHDDPYHYASSLLDMIAATTHQEIASHTFSHYYCLEKGQDVASFREDLVAARAIAHRRGISLRTLVFPRNQVNPAYLVVSREEGFVAFRGSPRSWLYDPHPDRGNSMVRRAGRLFDAYVPLSGDNSWVSTSQTPPIDLRGSRFLRPYDPRLGLLEPLRARRILRDLGRAARTGRIYHLWWHPHNFGAHLDANLNFLEAIFERFSELRRRYHMRSVGMAELADELAAEESRLPV